MKRTVVELIAAKRDGLALSPDEVKGLIGRLMDGSMSDYQMAAFLMATYFRGLDDRETVALTEAMLESGRVLELPSVPGRKVDKHSTGGVGDKVSLCLAPLVAACGVPVPMVSGRGLGHTGGTLDKLEAIPGFRTRLDSATFERIVAEVGVCMIGQTEEIAPADKRIYALRDVTATVECIPLIVASILSKKLAEGIDGLVLDVKVGRGAFMKTVDDARRLADALVRVGTRAGKSVVGLLTDMDVPMGMTVGNANETQEALEVLRGGGPEDLVECTLALGAEMLVLGGVAADAPQGRAQLVEAIRSGRGARTMERMIDLQGGDPRVVAHPERLIVAPACLSVRAPRDGYVLSIDPMALGRAAVVLGAGRSRAEDGVDPSVGISLLARPGRAVACGDELARIHTVREPDALSIRDRVEGAFRVGDAPPSLRPLILARVDAQGAAPPSSKTERTANL